MSFSARSVFRPRSSRPSPRRYVDSSRPRRSGRSTANTFRQLPGARNRNGLSSAQQRRGLDASIVPHEDLVLVRSGEMTDLEIRAPESANAVRTPRDVPADDRAGGVEPLHEKTDVRGVLPVAVSDVAVETAGAIPFGLDGPLEREIPLPAGNERR